VTGRTKTVALLVSSLLLLLTITSTLPQIIIQQPPQTATRQKNNSNNSITRETSPPTGTGWAKTYGGVLNDYGSYVQQTSDGGYIIAGTTSSFGAGLKDAWVLKLNSTGSVEWQKTYGGRHDDGAGCIQQTSDGGYIFGGYTTSFGTGYSDAWVLKLNSTGSVEWQKAYGTNGTDEAESIQQTSDGGYIVLGYTEPLGTAFGRAWVLKLNSTGFVDWQKTYGCHYGGFAKCIQQTSDRGYIVAGSTFSADTDTQDVWVLKLNSTGDVTWQNTYGGAGEDEAWSVQQTSDGGYIVLGHIDSNGWVLKLDSGGSVEWQKTYRSASGGGTYSFQQTLDGGYVLAGETASNGKDDFWVLRLNSTGSVEWQKAYGGAGYDEASCVRQTSDGGYIVSGSTDSFGAGENDIWVLRLNSTGRFGDDIVLDTYSGASTYTTSATSLDSNATSSTPSMTTADGIATVQETHVTPHDTHATVKTQSTTQSAIADPVLLIFAVALVVGVPVMIVEVALYVSRRR
jgi:uncharacterized delta-60 repeat protein